MKRTKLITSLCTLILTIACLTFGVYSAVKTSFAASGTITFNNYGIDADITINIYGVENGTEVDSTDENYGTVIGLKKRTVLASTGSTASARSAYQANVITTTSTLSLGELKFDELNTTVIDEWASKIVLVISFTNYSKFDAQLSITQESAAITNLTATYGSKIKATKSTDGTTGVVSTSSLTITLTPTDKNVSVSGTFNPQITLKPFVKEFISDLEKGDLITMNLEKLATDAGALTSTYRVLNKDEDNENIIEVVAMYDAKAVQKYWTTNQTQTISTGGNVTKYAGSDLDIYLNTTWYETLTNDAKMAIETNHLVQYCYTVVPGGGDDSDEEKITHASVASYSTKTKVSDLSEIKVYSLDVEDIEKYFGGTTGDAGKTVGTFSDIDLLKLFWDVEKMTSAAASIWLRSASKLDSQYAFIVSNSGFVSFNKVSLSNAARPAFKIDLSKIDWKLK